MEERNREVVSVYSVSVDLKRLRNFSWRRLRVEWIFRWSWFMYQRLGLVERVGMGKGRRD